MPHLRTKLQHQKQIAPSEIKELRTFENHLALSL